MCNYELREWSSERHPGICSLVETYRVSSYRRNLGRARLSSSYTSPIHTTGKVREKGRRQQVSFKKLQIQQVDNDDSQAFETRNFPPHEAGEIHKRETTS